MIEIKIDTDYIKLDQFLKLADLAQTGGHGKIIIKEGRVKVNNQVTLARGKKLYDGDIVEVEDSGRFLVKRKA